MTNSEKYLAGNEMHVTIWNDKGEIVVDEICKVHTASNDEIEDMIGLIDAGCDARTAAFLAKHPCPPDEPPMSGVEKARL